MALSQSKKDKKFYEDNPEYAVFDKMMDKAKESSDPDEEQRLVEEAVSLLCRKTRGT